MKITLPVALLINGTQAACDYNLDPSTWSFANGGTSDVQVTTTDGVSKISNTSGNVAQFYLPVKKDVSDPTNLKCDFPQLHMTDQNSQVGFYNFGQGDGTYNNLAQAILIPSNAIKYYSVHTYSQNQGGNYSSVNNNLQETGNDYYDNINVDLNTSSGTASVDQDKSNLIDFQSNQFTSGVTFLALRMADVGEFAEIKLDISKEAIELAKLKKDLAAKTTKLDKAETELTAKTTKLVQCESTVEDFQKSVKDVLKFDNHGASTDAPLNMVETDFSVKNAAALEKNSALNTSLIVYIQFGIIAVLTSVVAYQYKGIETLKRVANGSDYQKM